MDSDKSDPEGREESGEKASERRELSRRQFLVGGVALGASVGIGGAALGSGEGASTTTSNVPRVAVRAAAKQPDDIDVALINGKIHTMDSANSVVSEVLIADGRFIQVGNPKDKPGKDKQDKIKDAKDITVIDLKGRTVVPGLVESHIHVVSLGNRPGYHIPTENATSIPEVVATLASRRKDVPAGQWITSMGGWHPNMWVENRPVPPSTSPPSPLKYPTLQQLDAAIPDRPVFMYLGFTGPAVVNTLGKQYLENPPVPPAPYPNPGPVTVGADGLIAANAQAERALFYLRVIQTFDDKLRSTTDAQAYAASVGLTAMLDQVLFPIPGPPQPNWLLSNLDGFRMYDAWLQLDREEKCIVRLQTNFLQNQSDPALPELHERLKNQFPFFGNDMMMTGAIGEWAAPIGAGSVWMDAQRLVASYQWRNENAVSNLAQLVQCADAYEACDAEFGIKNLRWVVHHVPQVSTDALNRLKALGVGVPMKGFLLDHGHTDDGDQRRAVPHDPGQRHQGRPPRRRRAHLHAQPLAPHPLRNHGPERGRPRHQLQPEDHEAGGAAAVHDRERLVPPPRGRARLDRGRKTRRPRRAEQGLLHGPRCGHQEDPLRPQHRRRLHRPQQRHRLNDRRRETPMDSDQTTSAGGETAEPEPESTAEPRSISRKKFLAAGAGVVGGALGLSAAGGAVTPPTPPTPPKITPPTPPTPPVITAPTPPTPPTPPGVSRPIGQTGKDLVFVNGKIHTMDGTSRVVSEMRIRRGRFTEVGNKVDHSDAEVVNLAGRTVIPGLIEGHIHVVSLANRPGYHVPGVENARNIAEIQAVLAARRKDVPDGQFITSMGGWHPNLFAERRLPTLAELDAAVSDRPVFLYQQGGGPSVTNSLGKAFFESQSDALAGPVVVSATGAIATGNPNMSNRALYFLRKLQTMDDKERGAVDAMKYSASVGLTTHLDQTLPPSNGPIVPTQGLPNLDQFRMYDGWLAANRHGKSLVRLQMNFLHNETDINLPELQARMKNQFQRFGNDMMMTGGIGEWGAAGDGVGATWLQAQKLIAAAGWRNTNRNLSLSALQAELTGYETVAAMGYDISGTGLRWTLHHLNVATQAELNRCKALGIGVQAGAWKFVTGTGNAQGAPFRLILDSGVKAGIHQDGVHIATMNPFFAIYYATTGMNALGQQINAGQSITREEAIRLFTRENAWHLNMEDQLGSIETGKFADLLVLSDDYTKVTDEQLKRMLPLLTLVGGKVVYDAGVV